MIPCYVALCPHCHIVWNVDSWEDPRFHEHPSAPSTMTVGQYTVWCTAYRIASDRAIACLDASDHEGFDLAYGVMQTFLCATRASTVWCVGGEQLVTGAVVLNDSPECDTMVEEAMAWHDARRTT